MKLNRSLQKSYGALKTFHRISLPRESAIARVSYRKLVELGLARVNQLESTDHYICFELVPSMLVESPIHQCSTSRIVVCGLGIIIDSSGKRENFPICQSLTTINKPIQILVY